MSSFVDVPNAVQIALYFIARRPPGGFDSRQDMLISGPLLYDKDDLSQVSPYYMFVLCFLR